MLGSTRDGAQARAARTWCAFHRIGLPPFHRIFTDAEGIASCPVRMLRGRHRWVSGEHERRPREMKLNRKSVTWGLAGLALAGALVGGAGVAVAATGTTSPSTVSSADPPYGHMGGIGDLNGMGDMAGMAFGEDSPMAAAAGYLGLGRTDLQAQLRIGKSPADVAATQGRSVSGIEDAVVAAMTTSLDANTTLTAAEKAADLAVMRSHLDVMVTAANSSGAGFGPMGAGMGGMMGR